jgi:hypothetical protein
MEMRGGKEENLEMSRMQKEDGRNVKGPALQNRRVDWIRAKAPFGGRVCF